MLSLSVGGALIPALMEQVDADAKVALYGTLTSVGALVALVANIVFGALSDRTRSRWGRRNPWILAGGLIAAASLSAMGAAQAFWLLVVLYSVNQIGLNMLLAPLAAVLPDRVAPSRRGSAAAMIGFGTLLAQSLGSIVGAAFLQQVRTGLAIMPWIIFVTAAVFVIFAKDKPTRVAERTESRQSFSAALRNFRVPLERDYLLALVGRFTLLAGFYCVLLFQFYLLQDYVKLSAAGVAATIALGGTTLAVAASLGTLVSGPLSDRLGRRKVLVAIAGTIMAVSLVPLLIWPTQLAFLGFLAIGGFAYGIFIAIDQALMSDVLPDEANHGRDMGILNVSNTASQMVAPGIAALVLGASLGYGGVIVVAIALTLLAGVLFLLIRRAH
jgi:MFS family permease